MTDVADVRRSAERLAEELEEDGVVLSDEPAIRDVVVAELDYARRVPVFEGRRPLYGSLVIDHEQAAGVETVDAELLDLAELDLAAARRFADGRSAFLVRQPDRPVRLACFAHPIQYEAELVRLQAATGARIVQRTPLLGAVRLFTEDAVISWNDHNWSERPTAVSLLQALLDANPTLVPEVALGVLELAIHWLAPAHVGATVVIRGDDHVPVGLDRTTASAAPGLTVTARRHLAAVFSALQQHDLATIVAADGQVEQLEVGLLTTSEAEQVVDVDRGMRHRSAQRYSFDDPIATVVVVSEDGPVTVFHRGRAVAGTR